jgi:ABC-2 type transport system permease protein
MPRRNLTAAVRLAAHQTRYDLLSFRRDRQARLTTIVLPVLLFVVIASASGGETAVVHGHRLTLATYLAPGLAALGVVAASFGNLAIEVVAQRESGVLKRRRAHPVPAWVLLAGRTLTATAVALAVTAVLFVVAGNGYGVTVPNAGIPALALTVVVGAAAFAALGYAVSTLIRTTSAAQPVVQLVLFPFYVISGVLVPDDRLPERLRTIAAVFPLQHLAAALRQAADPFGSGLRLAPGHLLVLAAWAAGGFLVAERRFRWLPGGPPPRRRPWLRRP